MSALGQKQTCALQDVMSALPPIATAKAKFRKRPCLLQPRKRTCALQLEMSALGQKRTCRHAIKKMRYALEGRARPGQSRASRNLSVDSATVSVMRLRQFGRGGHQT